MKPVLIKISGELFRPSSSSSLLDLTLAQGIAHQIKSLHETHQIGIVIGAGNIFRGSKDGVALHLRHSVADSIGMLGTMINSLALQEIFRQEGLDAIILSAQPLAGIADAVSHQTIDNALHHNQCIIFAGGTGNPLFTTDTAAIIRAVQMGAPEVWKATKTDAVYDKDPVLYKDARRLPHLTYQQAFEQKIEVMDRCAFILAESHHLTLRVFDLFAPNALVNVARDPSIGSRISLS